MIIKRFSFKIFCTLICFNSSFPIHQSFVVKNDFRLQIFIALISIVNNCKFHVFYQYACFVYIYIYIYSNLQSSLLRCGTNRMNRAPNETRTHSCRFASLTNRYTTRGALYIYIYICAHARVCSINRDTISELLSVSVSLFNGISTFVDHLMQKTIIVGHYGAI